MRRILTALATAALVALAIGQPAAASTGGAGFDWQHVPDQRVFDGAIIRSVTAGPHGLVAVGGRYVGQTEFAAFWWSGDAVHWHRAHQPEHAQGVTLRSITAWRNGFIAVGYRIVGTPVGPREDVAIFRSRNGRTWTVDPARGRLHGAEARSVIARGSRLIMTGCRFDRTGGCIFGQNLRATVWISGDGHRWELADLPGSPGAYVSGVTRSRSGFVAVGGLVETYVDQDGFLVGQFDGAIAWTSRDGRHWRRPTPLDPDSESSAAADVTASTDRVVAVGSIDACAQVWTSSGRSPWQSSGDPYPLCPTGSAQMRAVAAFHGMFVATGEQESDIGAGVPKPGLWVSPDGLDWHLVDAPSLRGSASAIGEDVISWHGRIVVVGGTGIYEGEHLQASVWIGRPTGH